MSDDKDDQTVMLTYWERVTARGALFRQKRRCEKDIERQIERGWEPQPGCVDIPRERLRHVDSLLSKITDPDED